MDPREEYFQYLFRIFDALEYNCLPGHPLKKHPAGPWKGLGDREPNGRRITGDDIAKSIWVFQDPTLSHLPIPAFLFPMSGVIPLVVLDVDDMSWAQRALDDFGPSPLTVRTRRGVHFYYRAPEGVRVVSRSWLYGERSADVKASSGGVVAPGSQRTDGGLYEPSVSLPVAWSIGFLSALPVFNVETYERIWAESRPRARDVARSIAKQRPQYYVHVVKGKPVVLPGGLEVMGDIAGDTPVQLETGEQKEMVDVVPGTKVFAFDREDNHASGQVWRSESGLLFYTDWTLGVMWRIVDKKELEWMRAWSRVEDPQDENNDLLLSLWQRYQRTIELYLLPVEGYLDIPHAEGMTLVRAPHGTGKTFWANKAFEHAASAITITNTSALAEHNAARFNFVCYREGDLSEARKVSTTINSLPKVQIERPQIVHVDEADQVHGYLHSGKVPDAPKALRNLLDLLARAPQSFCTSADLSFEDLCLFIDCTRARNPLLRIRVFVKPPQPGKIRVRLVPLVQGKEDFHAAWESWQPGQPPTALGLTARAPAAHLAAGYGAAGEARCFWVSGENSRFYEVVERFRGTWVDRCVSEADFLSAADFFFFSPALQSGVSLENDVGDIFLLHDKYDFEIETAIQMLRRFRKAHLVTWAMSAFVQRYLRVDDCYLEGICVGLKSETDRILALNLPEYAGTWPDLRPIDHEFAWSWRITQRRLRRSAADPIGRAREILTEHGWEIIDLLDEDPDSFDPKGFNTTKKDGKTRREEAEAYTIVTAEKIEMVEARKLERTHVQQGTERQKCTRAHLEDFYGVDVSMDLVEMDGKGKFQKRCRNFTHVQICAEYYVFQEPPDVRLNCPIAWMDWKQNKNKEPSQYAHNLNRALYLLHLVTYLNGKPVESWVDPIEVKAETIQLAVRYFCAQYGVFYRALWRCELPAQDGLVRWAGDQLRRMGANVSYEGRQAETRVYSYSFADVAFWSNKYRESLLARFKQEQENEQWQRYLLQLREQMIG